MTFGFPARFVDERRVNIPQSALTNTVSLALGRLGWRCEQPTSHEFRAKVNMNLWSWGEELMVRVLPEGVVHVESRCAMFTQCFDWGKNRENVEKFFAEVERVTQAHTSLENSDSATAVFDEQGRTPIERVFSESGTK